MTFAVGGKAAGRRVVRERAAPLQQEDQAERGSDRGAAPRVLREAQRPAQEEDHGRAQAPRQAGLAPDPPLIAPQAVSLLLAARLSRADRELVKEAGLDSTLAGALVDLGQRESRLTCRATTPSEIRRLNLQFAGSDRATDVLAFPAQGGDDRGFQLPASEATFLGDIVISVRTAAGQAEFAGADPTAELRLLAVHGLLHLLGHDHAEAAGAARMTDTTQDLLDRDAARRGVLAPRAPVLQPPP